MLARILRGAGAAFLFGAALAFPAAAGTVFDDIKPAVFGQRAILDGRGVVEIKAPYRPDDIRAVPFDVEASFNDGRTIRAITFIVDNNPSPVAAAFRLGPGRDRVSLGIRFRLNQQSDVRAVVEASDGALYMVQQLVKFPGGQAACSAPPQTPPDEIAANMGKMTLADVPSAVAVSAVHQKSRLAIAHPNHTGMVLDQITLLYTPLKMVQALSVRRGDELVLEMDGSIGLNENPLIEFDFPRRGAARMTVVATDTDGARFEHTFPLGPSS